MLLLRNNNDVVAAQPIICPAGNDAVNRTSLCHAQSNVEHWNLLAKNYDIEKKKWFILQIIYRRMNLNCDEAKKKEIIIYVWKSSCEKKRRIEWFWLTWNGFRQQLNGALPQPLSVENHEQEGCCGTPTFQHIHYNELFILITASSSLLWNAQ